MTHTADDVRSALRTRIAMAGSLAAASRRLGYSPAFLRDVCDGKRMPGQILLKALGFRKVVGYERVRK